MDLVTVAAEAAQLVWALLRGAASSAGEAAGEAGTEIVSEEARGVVGRLWDRLRGHRAIEAAADDPGSPDALEELARQIDRAMARDEALATEVAALVSEAKAAGQVVDGHALVEGVRAGRDIWAEGRSATVRGSSAGQDVVARAQGAPERPRG